MNSHCCARRACIRSIGHNELEPTHNRYSYDNTSERPRPRNGRDIPYPRLDARDPDLCLLALSLFVCALSVWTVHGRSEWMSHRRWLGDTMGKLID
jgi:hypothetical protein